MHKVHVTPVIGLPKFDGWSHVVTNVAQTCAVAVSIVGLNARNIGRDVSTEVENRDVVTASDVASLVHLVVQRVEEAGANVSIAVIGVFDTQTFFATWNAQIILKRHTKVGTLLSSTSSEEVRQGTLQADDVFVLLTNQADTLAGEIKQKLIQGYDSDTIVTSIVPAVHNHEHSASIALGFVELREPEKRRIDTNSFGLVLEPDEVVTDLPNTPLIASPAEESDPLLESLPPTPLLSSSSVLKLPVLKMHPLSLTTLSDKAIQIYQQIVGRLNPLIVNLKTLNRVSLRYHTRQLLPLTVLAVVLIAAASWWLVRRNGQVQAAARVSSPIVAEIKQLAAAVDENPVESRSQIEDNISELERVSASFADQPVARAVVEKNIAEAKNILSQVSGKQELADLAVLADLRSIQPDWVGQVMDADATQSAVLDTGKQALIKMLLSTGDVSLVESPSASATAQLRDLVVSDGTLTTLGNGIHQLTLTDEAGTWREIRSLGDSNREATLIASYGPYVYVFNPAKRNIYRYTVAKDSVSDPIGWIVPGEKVTFDQITSMAVDGDVWLGTKTGQVVKLTTGRVVPFNIRGLAKPLTSSVVVYTKDFLNNVYILEPSAKRVVVVQKNGDFIKEMSGQALGTATDLVVSETDNRVIVVSGSAVFQVPL